MHSQNAIPKFTSFTNARPTTHATGYAQPPMATAQPLTETTPSREQQQQQPVVAVDYEYAINSMTDSVMTALRPKVREVLEKTWVDYHARLNAALLAQTEDPEAVIRNAALRVATETPTTPVTPAVPKPTTRTKKSQDQPQELPDFSDIIPGQVTDEQLKRLNAYTIRVLTAICNANGIALGKLKADYIQNIVSNKVVTSAPGKISVAAAPAVHAAPAVTAGIRSAQTAPPAEPVVPTAAVSGHGFAPSRTPAVPVAHATSHGQTTRVAFDARTAVKPSHFTVQNSAQATHAAHAPSTVEEVQDEQADDQSDSQTYGNGILPDDGAEYEF